MTAKLPQFEVSLAALLLAKEQRAQRQQQWLAAWQQPLISLTLVTPGAIKDNAQYRLVLQQAIVYCNQQLRERGWPVLQHEVFWRATGSEVFWCVKHSAKALKQMLLQLEEQHPLGRLWDFDVIALNGMPLSRHAFNLAPRRCLLCNEMAHLCARSRRHDLAAIQHQIERIIALGLPSEHD